MNDSCSHRRIKVLHLIQSVAYGGIETALINWVRHFDRDLIEVHVACFSGDRGKEIPFMRAAEAAGIPVLPVPWTKWKPFLRGARQVARIVRDLHIDIVHTHGNYGNAVGAIAGFLAPVKTISTIYVWGYREPERRLMELLDLISIQFMDKVSATCAHTARRTFVLGTSRDRIPVLIPGHALHNTALSPEQRREARRAAGIRDDEILLVNMARLFREKAQDQLLHCLRPVVDRYPNVRVWICGVGQDQIERELLVLRKQLNLEHAVELVGFKETWSTLDIADMMVHPSHIEGMPLAVLEGMAAGLPIVASAVSGIPEIIEHGRTGMLAADNDVAGFSKCILDLLGDRPRARTLGSAARERIRTDLSIEAAVSRVEQVYREILSQ
jgi:glycosyltransferase involved in cell wall biosynthesis